MTSTRAGRTLTVALLTAMTVVAAAGPATAGTDDTTGFASTARDGTDPVTGRTLHSAFTVFDPPDEAPFGNADVFVGDVVAGGGEGIVYECTTEERLPARLDGLRSASATGVLQVSCSSPEGLPDRRGHLVVALRWRGTGPVEQEVFQRENCTEYLDVRRARVTGGLVLVVPGVAVAPLTDQDPAESDLRRQRIVCD